MHEFAELETPAQRRAYLKAHYGCPEAGPTTPHERVTAAIERREPDRVPFDFWAVPETCAALRTYLGVETDEGVLRLLGVDCRLVAPDYVGPAPRVQPDGSYFDAWGTHRRRVANDFSVYDEYASFPLAEAQSRAEVETWPGWPDPAHWDVSTLEAKIQALNAGVAYHVRYEVGGIFEWSWGLVGLDRFLIDLKRRPEVPCAVMDCFTDLYIANVSRVLEAADGLMDMVYTYDDVGIQSGLMLSPGMWREFILPRHRRLNAAIRRYPVKIMYHSCGAVFPLIGAFADEMGIDVLNPLQPRAAGMDMARIKREFGGRLAFHGGVDIQHTLPQGTPGEVQAEVRQRCAALGRGGGYICASAHYIQADTPLDNILAMYTAPRELNSAA
ncbi:MAG: uroporphyrinogen decarboxylase family protein [Chloroflexota bacterium]